MTILTTEKLLINQPVRLLSFHNTQFKLMENLSLISHVRFGFTEVIDEYR